MTGEQCEWAGFTGGFTAGGNHARRGPGCTAAADAALDDFDGNVFACKPPGDRKSGDSAADNQDFHDPAVARLSKMN